MTHETIYYSATQSSGWKDSVSQFLSVPEVSFIANQ